ncbi:hypothetical protein BTN49_0256 [Candidatus Enterovibrio escicola]|uniref:Uncharacterized protein n=1 Tax=Candidatus Enterovibrio escicola TaxID=1927127 RepID=A0A2A5T7B2_9GAMM|nr:hypothetical protein [Candidatus Enterovibrio escacola]PCS24063.1 hypothetical protein BTN49_0256 [Candidatus Enterovibrio escacola]
MLEVLSQLTYQDISIAPELAIGDGALGFWNAVTKHWPTRVISAAGYKKRPMY